MRNWLNSQPSSDAGTVRGTMRTGYLLSCLMALFVMLFAASASAQLSGKGQITGTVTDKTGAVIPGAEVTAINTATQIKVVAKTTAAGDYHFSALDAGIYTVTASAPGFQTLKQENIHVNAMESQVYNPALVVAGGKVEEITVSAEPPQLETSNATLGSTMEQETYSELPVEMGAYGQADQRRATDFAFLMPGVQGNNTNGNATTNVGVVNGSGSRGAAAAVYVDGIPFVRAGGNGDPRYVWTAISVDAIDQFQVQTTGYSALYEGQGVMNYTVKLGGAQYHGSVYEFVRNTALDTWGFWGKAPVTVNGVTTVQKPTEHSNEYGINLSGPLVPFGGLKNKLFAFTNYNGFRFSNTNPTYITFPTYAQQQGDFSALLNLSTPIPIYDPSSQAACTANSDDGFCRYQYGYSAGSGKGHAGNPTLTGTKNVIPSSQFSTVAKNTQQFLPTTGIGTALQNNFLAQNPQTLTNWSTTSRIDYVINSKDTFSVIGAVGRQASANPAGQTTSGRNVGPIPYNYGQTYAPKTAVWILEETHTFNSNLLNQIKWGYARYNGPTFTPDQNTKYAASTMGISGTPAGQASSVFPIVAFGSSNNPPTQWNGTTANSTIAENYTLLDNLQWNFGRHSLTFGGQIAWMLYNTASATGAGSTPLTLTSAVTETGYIHAGSYTIAANTGSAYASYLIGQVDKGSFTDYSYHPEYGARFRAISPYVQDDWKVNSKLTVNLGLRYDFFPTVREVNNMGSFFNPSLANSVTGLNGALQFSGFGTNTCNCATPVNNYYKNFAPRIGLAYQVDSKTVVRASYGVMFTHGDAVGGLASTLGTLGFSSAPSFSSVNDVTAMTGLLAGGNGVIPSYTAATGTASGATYGTGYMTVTGYTGSPSSMTYDDPYVGSRAPEYINWSFGIQRQLSNAVALTASYVGSEGHFLQLDSYNARGYWANALDPKYLYIGSHLADTGKTATTVTQDCSTYGLTCPGLSLYSTSQPLSGLLKPFPFHSISDSFGYVGNANYHALQAVLNVRNWHGLNTILNYTWSKAIDDAGSFRSGYAIPQGTIYNQPTVSWAADRIERTLSTSHQPQHLVATVVYKSPLGKSVLATNPIERAILGGYSLSGIYQAYAGSPLSVTMSSTNVNPASAGLNTASYNPNFSGPARVNGKWGHGVTTGTAGSVAFIDSNAFVRTGDYTFGNLPRTAPYNLYGPGNYQVDLSLARSFPLHLTEASKFEFRAQWYNVTNHTQFAVASTAWGNSSFGQVTTNTSANRKAAQFTARISF
ncbi:MAG: TonB-dependent receptor [Terracidiphilus sp.]|nr:TonB-dependent receptor [Terracidiphilus sp.]